MNFSKVPYTDKNETGYRLRTFNKDVQEEELIWHTDERDRVVEVVESKGWQFQFDDELPFGLQIISKKYNDFSKPDQNSLGLIFVSSKSSLLTKLYKILLIYNFPFNLYSFLNLFIIQ